MLNDLVNFETAEFLDNRIYGDDGYVYAAEDVECTFDNSLSVLEKHKGDVFYSGDCYHHGKVYYAPTIAEVLDDLTNRYNIFIEFTPWFTFALNEHVAYTYKVFKINYEEGRFETLFSSDNEWLASMQYCLLEILKKIITE